MAAPSIVRIATGLFQFEDQPADRGLKSWNYQPGNTTNSQSVSAGICTGAKVRVPYPTTVTNAHIILGTAGVNGGAVLANCFIAVFDKTGHRLGLSADQTSVWTSAVLAKHKVIALVEDAAGSLTLPGGPSEYVYVVRLIGTQSTTNCAHGARAQVSLQVANAGLMDPTSGTAFAAGVIPNAFYSGTAQAAIPTDITMSTVTAGIEYWAGLS